jgi:hypothetical protein
MPALSLRWQWLISCAVFGLIVLALVLGVLLQQPGF